MEMDIGFRTLKIDTSNMADVYYAPDALHEPTLTLTTSSPTARLKTCCSR
jgi:hypothetical protein